MDTREDTQYALEMKKQHQRVMLADVIEGFRKMRSSRISEEEKTRENRKAEAESMIRALLDQEGVPVVGIDGVMTTPSKSKRRGVGGGGLTTDQRTGKKTSKPTNDDDDYTKKKKLGIVHGRNVFAATGSDITEMKYLDQPYGITVFNSIRESLKNENGDMEMENEGEVVVKEEEENVSEGFKKPTLSPAHERYKRMVGTQLDIISDILYERKRKRIADEEARMADIKKIEAACTDADEPILTQKERTKAKKLVSQQDNVREISAAVYRMKTESASEKGEKNLLAFVERFHGGFFYQKKQLFFEGFQLLFLNSIIPILAPNIVGTSWSVIGPRICKQFGWVREDFQDVMVAQAPRRFGKTIAIAAIVINYLLSKSPCEIAVFSTCKRISGFLLEKVKDIMIQSGYKEWIISIGGEHIYLRDPDDPDDQVRKISFYPASVVISISSSLHTIFYSFLHFSLLYHLLHPPPISKTKQVSNSGLFFFYFSIDQDLFLLV
jgi:hypothetical protein